MKFKIYLAGPDVFQPNAKELGEWKIKTLSHSGLEGLYPLDNEIKFGPNVYENGARIARANVRMIHECHGILANLQPFRGPSADVGTVWECAYGKGLGKIVIGYGFDLKEYRTRVINGIPHDGMMIENFGAWDNIMLVHGLDAAHREFLDAVRNIKERLQAA